VKNESGEFVVLEHTASDGVHWDLMLEETGALLTWRLAISPEKIGSGPVEALRIFDHPLRFLTYEGPVQQNTGAVKRIDQGVCRWMDKDDRDCRVYLDGTSLRGTYLLSQQERASDWIIRRQ